MKKLLLFAAMLLWSAAAQAQAPAATRLPDKTIALDQPIAKRKLENHYASHREKPLRPSSHGAAVRAVASKGRSPHSMHRDRGERSHGSRSASCHRHDRHAGK